uniref:Uncharacterized protein n=1 Tax=viral metagenome TaxID=1070528 RepID=A0A6C0DY63_9ZZZZ
MNIPEETIIKVGKYTFNVIERKSLYDGNIISHTFKIGGDYKDCVNLSYTYKNGKPISAKLPHLMYEPECTVGSDLEKGIGSEVLIKTLLRYAHNKIKDVDIFYFDDMSHIDCKEKNLLKSPPRKPQSPLKLAYFSIVYNSKTWYEKHFNATMTNKAIYNKYKEKLSFLTSTSEKVDFIRFLEISTPPPEQYEILKKYYNTSKTYRDFFNSVPYKDRCELLLPWLHNFILFYLSDVYIDNGWEININTMDIKNGGFKKSSKRKTHKLYPSKYKIINYSEIHNIM